MRYIAPKENIQASIFTTPDGLTETYLVVGSKSEGSFEQAISKLWDEYQWALNALQLGTAQLTFARFYLSDIVNQLPTLENSDFAAVLAENPCSLVEQRPLTNGEVILLTYFVGRHDDAPLLRKCVFDNGPVKCFRTSTENYNIYYGSNFHHHGNFDAFDQTAHIFEDYIGVINAEGMTLMNSSIRTWIYVRDIDNHYAGMVEARKDLFEAHGLNAETRYIASTGIEAKLATPSLLVGMDFLNIQPLSPDQIVRMEALSHLGPTIDYGVTFERGTKVVFGDRSHLFISGTASINPAGEVLFPFDAKKQTIRALENISALLAPHGADLCDVAYFIIYARNPADSERILQAFRETAPKDAPFLFVEGSVCRPTWLVEIECVAITPDQSAFPSFA